MIKTKHRDVARPRSSGRPGSKPCKCLENKRFRRRETNAKAPEMIGTRVRCLRDGQGPVFATERAAECVPGEARGVGDGLHGPRG